MKRTLISMLFASLITAIPAIQAVGPMVAVPVVSMPAATPVVTAAAATQAAPQVVMVQSATKGSNILAALSPYVKAIECGLAAVLLYRTYNAYTIRGLKKEAQEARTAAEKAEVAQRIKTFKENRIGYQVAKAYSAAKETVGGWINSGFEGIGSALAFCGEVLTGSYDTELRTLERANPVRQVAPAGQAQQAAQVGAAAAARAAAAQPRVRV